MSDPSSAGSEKTGAPKKPTSSARNIIGLVVLIGVIAFGVYEYTAKSGYNKAVTALDTRSQAEDKELMTVQEAESLLGKESDGPSVDFKEDIWSYDKKTYTWRGLLKHYTLTAYYTKGQDPRLHHFETEGSKYELKPVEKVDVSQSKTSGGPASKKGPAGKTGNRGMQPEPQPTMIPGLKGKTAEPSDKAATPKPEPSDKAATPKPEPSDKAASPKPEPTGKAASPKPEPTGKAASPKSTPPGDPIPKSKASAPSDTGDKPK